MSTARSGALAVPVLQSASRDIAKEFGLGIVPFADHYPRLAEWSKRIEVLPVYDRTYVTDEAE